MESPRAPAARGIFFCRDEKLARALARGIGATGLHVIAAIFYSLYIRLSYSNLLRSSRLPCAIWLLPFRFIINWRSHADAGVPVGTPLL